MRRVAARFGVAALLVVACLAAGVGAVAQEAADRQQGAADDRQDAEREPDVPYVSTPMPVVEAMLELARVDRRDSLFDLGSGDGRIVVAAAERYGTPGVGVEIDSGLVARSRESAREAGVEELVSFVRGDLFEVDLRPASVVTLYLLSTVNRRLRPKLLEELRPGARVVSHAFGMGEWPYDTMVRVPPEGERGAYVYHWVIPARVAGTWRFTTTGGEAFTVDIDQLYQQLRMRVVEGPTGAVVRDPWLRGTGLEFVLTRAADRGQRQRFVGSAFGDEMTGAFPGGAWTATRIDGTGQPIDRW